MSVRQPLKPRFTFPRESQGRRQKKFFKEYKMNAVSLPLHCSGKGAVKDIAAFNDAGDCIESWGIRWILSGRLFGFALGGVLVAVPLTAGVLVFGTIGTSIVDAIECAVIAGGFGALAAAFYDQGAVRGSIMQFERKLAAGRAACPQTPIGTPLIFSQETQARLNMSDTRENSSIVP